MTNQQDSGDKAVFIDRDGTLNEEVNYLSQAEKVRILPNAIEGIKLLKEAGFKIIVISNQSGVARGYFTEEDVQLINSKINELIMQSGANIDGFYYCPHHPEGAVDKYRRVCQCRKPESSLFLQAAAQKNIDIKKSFIVGDKLSDIQMSESLGARAILLLTGYGPQEREKYCSESHFTLHYIAEDLLDVARWILQQTKENERKN